VEAALLSALVLLPLMGGVIYFGGMVIVQENLAVAARSVARGAALSSLEAALGKKNGVGRPSTDAVRQQALSAAVANARELEITKVNWSALNNGRLRAIDGYTAEMEWTAPISVTTLDEKHKSSHQMGVGVLFHGATVERSYKDFAPVGRLAHLSALTPSVSATSVMPTELPPVGEGGKGVKGLLNLNSWITDIVNEPAPKADE
jgi:hypothetical protein